MCFERVSGTDASHDSPRQIKLHVPIYIYRRVCVDMQRCRDDRIVGIRKNITIEEEVQQLQVVFNGFQIFSASATSAVSQSNISFHLNLTSNTYEARRWCLMLAETNTSVGRKQPSDLWMVSPHTTSQEWPKTKAVLTFLGWKSYFTQCWKPFPFDLRDVTMRQLPTKCAEYPIPLLVRKLYEETWRHPERNEQSVGLNTRLQVFL